jgi:hypothetical protein
VSADGGGNTFPLDDSFWHLVGYRLKYNTEPVGDSIIADSTSARLYIDLQNAGEETSTTQRNVFLDSTENTHTIGTSYEGFMYDVQMFAYDKTTF